MNHIRCTVLQCTVLQCTSQPLIITIAGNLTNLVPQLVVMILVPLQHPVQVCPYLGKRDRSPAPLPMQRDGYRCSPHNPEPGPGISQTVVGLEPRLW